MDLVIGATGRVGSAAVDALLAMKRPVRVLVRSKEKGAPHAQKGCEVVVGDVTDRASLDAAVKGATSIASLFGTPRIPQTRLSDYVRIELEGNRNVIDAALATGTKPHIVYLSGLNTDRAPDRTFFGVKVKTEAALAASGLPYTILRPTVFLQDFAQDFVDKGLARLPGKFPNPASPIHAADIGLAAARCLGNPERHGKTYLLFGPEKMGFREGIERWSRESGTPVRFQQMPLAAFWAIAQLLSFKVPVLRPVYHLMWGFNSFDWSGDCSALRELIGREPTTLSQFARGS